MSQQVKLVVAEQLNQQKVQFLILQNQIVGKGSFGIVKKAVRKDKPTQQLVVKIIPYENQTRRQQIQRQISILRKLPQHPNLVNILPIKCYSNHNYYIFMQYCSGGTLEELIQTKKGSFTQNQIFDVFYQLMNGYRVLWEAKILHQDLKLQNVLIKNGLFKLADFGFSILYEGVKHGRKRAGTLHYMPLQKIIQSEYYATTKSDVYSMGVMLFKLITGHHPYIRNNHKQLSSYVSQFIKNQLYLKPNFSIKFSIKFQHFFDLVLKMVAKSEKSRIDFETVYEYMQNQQIFEQIKKKVNKQQFQKTQNMEKNFIITNYTEAIAINFQIPENQQKNYEKQIMQKNKNKKELEYSKINKQIEQYIVSRRIIVYYFDRLTRRLFIQKVQKKAIQIQLYNEIIISLFLFCKKIIQQLLKQSKTGQSFTISQWKLYRNSYSNLIRMIERDQNYLQDLIVDCLSQNIEIKAVDKKKILDKSKSNINDFMQLIKQKLIVLYQKKSSIIKPDDRQNLITLCYINSGIQILQNFQNMLKNAINLQNYFRIVETQDSDVLFNKVVNNFMKGNIQFAIDLGEDQF